MNGFADHDLSEDAFGEKKGLSVRAFDAFPKTKPSYQQKTQSGGIWTVALIALSCLLCLSELRRWWAGHTTHNFGVEKGISHDLQINLDIVMAMKCEDIRVNVQDASGDRILAGETLARAGTMWWQWEGKRAGHQLGASQQERDQFEHSSPYREDDVHDYLGAAAFIPRTRSFPPTPRVPGGHTADSCRIYGTLAGNKVQGDFHITARGHGYMEFGEHLDHTSFNFTHQINELSFGPFYPSLTNPLDNTRASTEAHFYKFQYYVSVVPTVYTTDSRAVDALNPATSPGSSDEALVALRRGMRAHTVFTNQYAVTEQSHAVPEFSVPGVFVKYDIEPILLTIAEERDGWLAMLVRIVNVVSGILVAGGWAFQFTEWAKESLWQGRRKRANSTFDGFLHGRTPSMEEK